MQQRLICLPDDEEVEDYSVYLFEKEECWCFHKSELISTGEFVKEKDHLDRDGTVIRVGVDKKGRGKILGVKYNNKNK